MRNRKKTGAAAIIGLVAAGALGLGTRSALELRDADAEQSGRDAAVAAASQQVVGLITVSDQTTQDDLDALREGATSDFAAELEEQSAALRKALQQQKVVSTGTVASAGVVSWSPEKARVIVAAVGEVKNAGSAGAPRAYRLQVDLRNVEGRWLVSDMEFVA